MSNTITPFLTKREAAAYLSLSVSTLDRRVRQGYVPAIKLGRGVRFTVSDLLAYAEQCRHITRKDFFDVSKTNSAND
jgi:excisionase family DNA binding protein